MSLINLFSVAGIIYDIAGAILLAEAIVRTRHETFVLQSQHREYSGGNVELFGAFEEQRHDAWFGLGLLVGGFVLQLFAAIGCMLAVSWLSGSSFAAVLVAVLLWWRIWAKRLAATRRHRYAAMLQGMDRLNFLAHGQDVTPPGRGG